jgi:beta-phosphoglucomutase-like phosphatase (HAD superfamily)
MGRLVLFDLDNTLADRAGACARWVARFAAEHGIDDDGINPAVPRTSLGPQ